MQTRDAYPTGIKQLLTKNGFSTLAPTVFMHLGDVQRLYPTVFEVRLRGFRRTTDTRP